MITLHHSFSTRIFLDGPAASAAGAPPAPVREGENLREFWWFLRSGHRHPAPPTDPARRQVGHRHDLQTGGGHAR